MSIDNFYKRNVQFFKHMRLIDSDNDGIKDTLALMPTSNQYFLQIGVNQNMDDLGIYDRAENDDFEIIDFGGFWDEDNDGINDGFPPNNFSGFTNPIYGDTTGSTSGGNYGCMDPNSPYYSPFATDGCMPEIDYDGSITGVSGATYIPDCCNFGSNFPGAGFGDNAGGSGNPTPPTCLAFYTDWGPWNPDMLLNDTNQLYNIKETCSYTVRFINTFSQANNASGGWHGAKLKIELNSGSGFVPLTSSSPEIDLIEGPIGDLTHISNGEWTLGSKVRIGVAIFNPTLFNAPYTYWYTKPYRDLIFTPPSGTVLKLTFTNGNINTNWITQSNKIGYQVFKGFQSSVPTAAPENPNGVAATSITNGSWGWSSTQLNTVFGNSPTIYSSASSTRLLYGPFSTGSFVENNWIQYLGNNANQNWTTGTPSAPINTPISSFYVGRDLIDDRGVTNPSTVYVLSNIVLSPGSFNLQGEVFNGILPCTVTNNNVSYFDKDGDGMVEIDTNYPTTIIGSVDSGLFSRTRYDSPYIFIKPGTSDGITPFTNPLGDNDLTKVLSNSSPSNVGGPGGATTTPSTGGWREYGYGYNPSTTSYLYKITSPTCQLGGCDIVPNSWGIPNIPSLVESSNINIFLPQPDPINSVNCGTYGNNNQVILHWNTTYDAKGDCCAKAGTIGVDNNGPWEDTECPRCHLEMTTRSAQPVLDPAIRTSMQTTDSPVYYGPFYDPSNPTYNGYGLAFSKANNWCRNVKQLDGVKVTAAGDNINPYSQIAGLANYQIMGGIIHGGAYQPNPNNNFNHPTNPLNVTYNINQWYTTSSNAQGCPGTKFPLKCKKVSGTENGNCPSGNCMKCLFCFLCDENPIQPGVFTGTINPTGSTNNPNQGPLSN